MLNIVLVEPEIPQNCGNIARTCAATGAHLHLVKPLGFDISDRAVKRAGLDYWYLVDISVYENLADLFAKHPEAERDCWLATTKAPQDYCQAEFKDGCWLFFGKETAGLPEPFRVAHYERCIRLPRYGRNLYGRWRAARGAAGCSGGRACCGNHLRGGTDLSDTHQLPVRL